MTEGRCLTHRLRIWCPHLYPFRGRTRDGGGVSGKRARRLPARCAAIATIATIEVVAALAVQPSGDRKAFLVHGEHFVIHTVGSEYYEPIEQRLHVPVSLLPEEARLVRLRSAASGCRVI